jgi:putrescine transport system permease protein
MKARPRLGLGQRVVLALPYLYLTIFFLAPFALIVKISLSQQTLAIPPYAPAFDWADGPAMWLEKARALGLDAWRALFADSIYAEAMLWSLALAALATLGALLVGFPLALAIARSDPRWRPLLVMLAVAPFWTSFLIRVYAWIMILKDEGLLNNALIALGLISAPLEIFATKGAVVIGIVYSYLPFMVLPLYAALDKQDASLREAAADLGATPWRVFASVTLPLALPGVMAGALLVFIPAVGEFVIPDLLGGSDTLMIGRQLWNEFFANRDWPTAAAVAIALLALIVGPLTLYERYRLAEEGAGLAEDGARLAEDGA